MADTTNYQWTKPVVDGSSGAWGQILNDAIDAIDTDLKTVETAAAAAQTAADDAADENLNVFGVLMPAIAHALLLGVPSLQASVNRSLSAGLGLMIDAGSLGDHNFAIPIEGLAAGMTITGFKSHGSAPSGTTLSVSLYTATAAGNYLQVLGSEHSHSTSETTLTKSGLSVAVAANTGYFIVVRLSRTSTAVSPFLQWVQPIVERA